MQFLVCVRWLSLVTYPNGSIHTMLTMWSNCSRDWFVIRLCWGALDKRLWRYIMSFSCEAIFEKKTPKTHCSCNAYERIGNDSRCSELTSSRQVTILSCRPKFIWPCLRNVIIIKILLKVDLTNLVHTKMGHKQIRLIVWISNFYWYRSQFPVLAHRILNLF